MNAPQAALTGDEFAQLGHRIYEEQVKPQLTAADEDKYVAIDIHTGDYEVHKDDRTAGMTLRARQPAAEVWLERAGWPAAYCIGYPKC